MPKNRVKISLYANGKCWREGSMSESVSLLDLGTSFLVAVSWLFEVGTHATHTSYIFCKKKKQATMSIAVWKVVSYLTFDRRVLSSLQN